MEKQKDLEKIMFFSLGGLWILFIGAYLIAGTIFWESDFTGFELFHISV